MNYKDAIDLENSKRYNVFIVIDKDSDGIPINSRVEIVNYETDWKYTHTIGSVLTDYDREVLSLVSGEICEAISKYRTRSANDKVVFLFGK